MSEEAPKTKTENEIREEAAAAASVREAAVITGGPGSEAAPEPSFKVKYKGKEFNSEAELTAYLDELGTEIQTLKTKPAPVAPAEPKPTAPATVKKRLEDLEDADLIPLVIGSPKELVTRLKGELREEYQAAENNRKAMDKFWVDFWDQNKELKPFENIVKMVMDGNLRTLAPMSMSDAATELAKLSRNTVLTINKDAFQKKKDPAARAIVEGAGTSAAAAPKNEEQQNQKKGSLTSMIKERQRLRAAAANGSQRARVS